MDIGKINNNYVNTTINNTASKSVGDDFENRLVSAFNKEDEKELKIACQEFEGILLNMMYKEMKATVPKSELIPSDIGKDIFDSMLEEELVTAASKSRGVGLGDVLYNQLSKRLKATYKADPQPDGVLDTPDE